MLRECPGCGEEYDPANRYMEFRGPDGIIYCCDLCADTHAADFFVIAESCPS